MKLKHILKAEETLDVSKGIRINDARRLKPGTKVKFLNEILTVKEPARKDPDTQIYLLTFLRENGKIYNMPVPPARRPVTMTPGQREDMRRNIKMISEQYKDNPKRLSQMAQSYYMNFTKVNQYPEHLIRQLMRVFPTNILKEAKITLN